ncbi:MAG: hypothetical protein HGA54_06970, partial [Actinobacteria bacterium]|nr:hypothetical protein [Actinomycetota bacterium]
MKRMHLKRFGLVLVLALCVTTICVMVGACSKTPSTPDTPDTPDATETASLVFPTSYDELFASLSTMIENNQDGSGIAYDTGVAKEAASTEAGDTAASANYSTTNTQVSGIDEGDIVKTDGEYIYSISNGDVIIVEPAGSATREIARITIASDSMDTSKELPQDRAYRYPSELYIQGDMLAIVSSINNIIYELDTVGEPYQNVARTEIDLYDVSDPANPAYVKTLGQDGYFTSSRMTGGILYLISNYYLYDYESLSADVPTSYVPSIYENGTAKLIDPSDICIMPEFDTISFTVISSVNLEDGSRISTQCML